MPWLMKNHPSWLEWEVNKKSVPTETARSKSNPGPILDFTNPDVQRFWMANYITPYLKNGFTGIDWDNPMVYNAYSSAGHYDLQHHFVRQYNGGLEDIHYARAQIQALGDFLERARTVTPKAQFDLAAPIDCEYAPMTSWLLPLRYVNTIVDEEGYSFWGSGRANYIPTTAGPYCSNRWLDKTEFYIQMQKEGKGLVLINQEPYDVTSFMTDTNMRARADIQSALANYLLVKYSHTYFWFGGSQQYGSPLFVQREEAANLGTAVGDMAPLQGVYARSFTKGMALVNPSSTQSFTINLPHGRFKDLYGKKLNSVNMLPHSGIVLETIK